MREHPAHQATSSADVAGLCNICKRVPWGDMVRLGFGKERHAECYPGSQPWLENFKTLPADQQTEEGKILARFNRHPEAYS